MKHNHIGKALRYKLRSSLPGIAVFYAIATIVLTGLVFGAVRIVINFEEVEISTISGFGMAAAIMVFVIGIVTIREDLRLFIQHGYGRRTIFIVECLIIMIISMILAIGERLFITVGTEITRNSPGVKVFDLYQSLFVSGTSEKSNVMINIESTMAFFAVITTTYLIGMLISLIFYRLNKLWTVIVAVGGPLFIFVGLPILINYFRLSFVAPAYFLTSSPWIFTGFTLAAAAVLAFFNWLLFRRAPVKSIAK